MAEQRQQPGMGQHFSTFRADIAKSIPLSNGVAALLMTGLQEIFNNITDCPCNYGVVFGLFTLVGPIIILVVFLATVVYEACRARRDPDKRKRLARYSAFTIVSSVSWLSVALLNSEAVCCIQGGFPSNSPCLVGRNATTNVVQYKECTANSRLNGVLLMTYGGAISSIVLAVVHAKCGHHDPNVPLESVGPSRSLGLSQF